MRRKNWARAAVGLLMLAGLVGVGYALGWGALLPNRFARLAIAERRYDHAEQWIAIGRRLGGAAGESEFLLARLRRKQGRLDEVTEHLQQAYALGVPVERLRREELLAMAQTGDLDEIQPELDRMLIDQQGDGAEIAEAYVNGLLIASRFDDAQVVLKAWQESYPDDPQPHFLRGRVFEHYRNWSAAEKEYREALHHRPDHDPSAFSLGRLLIAQHRPDEALMSFRQCDKPPYRSVVSVWIARALKTLGRTDEARAALHTAVTEDPERLREAARLLGDTTDAADAAYELGTLESAAGNYEEALRWLERAVEQDPRNHDARYARAVALRGIGKTDEAQREFAEVQQIRDTLRQIDPLIDSISENPSDIEARYRVGMLYLQYGSEETGLFWLRSVFKYDPDHAATHQALAEYFASKSHEEPGYAQLAAEHRQRALGRSPTEE